MPRWPADEEAQLAQMRRLLSRESAFLNNSRPDVVGERRMLRFLRGQDHNVELATAKYKSFLLWREANNVDSIRDDILFSGRIQSPFDFPGGSKILHLVPQIIIAHNSLDRSGNPLAMEMFNFAPSEVLSAVSKEEYSLFMIYLLEYRSLVLEQMSCEAEDRLKRSPGIEQLTRMDANGITYGVLLSCLIIRDFEGLGLHHVSGDGQTVLKLILEIAVANYPEQQYRCHMVNLPWFFNSVWFVLRNMFDKRMLSKLTMSGGSQEYMKKLLLDIDIENIPAKLGGRYTGYNPPYSFNLSVDGPFFYPGCPYMSARNTLPAEINDNQVVSESAADSDAAVSVSPLHDAAAEAEEEDGREAAGEQEEVIPADLGPSLSSEAEAEAAERVSSVSFAPDDLSKGSASSPLSRRSRGLKIKHIMRLFSPSQQSDSSSKGSPSLLPPSQSPLPSPSQSQALSQQRQRQSGGASIATPRDDGAMPSYRSDLDTATTLPSDGSSDPAWSHLPLEKSGLRRPSRSHRRESSISSLESSTLPYSPPAAGEHSQRHRSSRGSSQRTSRVHSPSEKRRSSSRRHSQHSSSREEKEEKEGNRSPVNTVTVGLSGRDSRERDAAQQPRAKVKAPKPGESIEHWKARVNYSTVDAAASDDLHRQCYSCFASIDNGNSTDGGSFWICF